MCVAAAGGRSVRSMRDVFTPSETWQERTEHTRPWLGVRFTCTGVYLRVYRNKEGTAYQARCPSCGRAVRFRVGSGGTASRFFEVVCGG
jgi:hypothetical protein